MHYAKKIFNETSQNSHEDCKHVHETLPQNGLVTDNVAEASAVHSSLLKFNLHSDVTCGLAGVKSSCLYYLLVCSSIASKYKKLPGKNIPL